MKSRDYWHRRFEILEMASVKKGQDYLATLDREYRTAMQGVEADISRWYRRFAENNNITLSEARQWLSKSQLAELKWSVEDYIKYGQENAINQQWAKQLENASAKVHISRLEALQLEMQQKIEVLYGNQLDGVDALARRIYSDGYYHTAFEVHKGFNIGWDLMPLNQKQIDRVISKPWTLDKETFSDRIWNQKNALLAKVQTEMTQALLRGDAPDKAIDAIAKQFNVSKSQAGRLVMTESAYFASEAQKDCFDSLDVEKFEIVATLDSRTSEICQSLDGHVELMKNYKPGITAPPFHPWCRSTTVPYFEDNFGERAARGAGGKTQYVPSNMKYEEWKKTFVAEGKKTDAQASVEAKQIQPEVRDYRKFKNSDDVNSYFTNDDDYKKWVEEVNPEEQAAINEYTSSVYKQINSYNRQTHDWAPDGYLGRVIDEAEEFMLNPPIIAPQGADESFFAYKRRVNSVIPPEYQSAVNSKRIALQNNEVLDRIISNYELKDDIITYRAVTPDALPSYNSLSDLIGKSYSDSSFMSTSPALDSVALNRDIMMEIAVPQGKNRGMYLEQFTAVNKEYEFLLPRNSNFTITDVVTKGSKTIIKMEMVG